MTDIVVRRRRRRAKPRARTGPVRLHIVSFRFAPEGPVRRMTTVLVQGRMDQCAAMTLAAAEAWTRGPQPWLTGINTVPPLRATPALDAICRRHTASATFLALLTQPAGYRPSIRLDLMGRDGVVLARELVDLERQALVARRAVGHERQPPDPHHVIGGERRQAVAAVEPVEARHRDRMGRVQVDHGAGRGPARVHHPVEEGLLGAGSSSPSDALVGVISQPPSGCRTEMLPVDPKVRPRRNSEAPTAHTRSRRAASLTTAAPRP